MKHLYSYIVFCLAFFNGLNALALTPELPEDFDGIATQDILLKYDEDDDAMSVADQLSIMYEAATYLYKKYSLKEMSEESFVSKIKPFFPLDSKEELESKRKMLYNGSGIYQYGKTKYTEFINRYLVPRTHKKIHNAAEYDHIGEVPYMEVEEGEFIKVYNFKKFLSYSDDPDERAAIKEYEETHSDKNWWNQFNDMMRNIEWKKVFLYGVKYENPLYSQEGISQIQQTPNTAFRIVSRHSSINGASEVEFGLQTVSSEQTFLLANNISPVLKKPQIDLSASENIAADYQIMYPVPIRSVVYPEIYKYTGTNMIIIKVQPLDLQKEIVLRANISFTECDYKHHCQPSDFKIEQTLPPHSSELFDNGLENYFFRAWSRIPPAENDRLQLLRFNADKDETGQSLYFEFKSPKAVRSFNLFIEDADGYTTFATPQIQLQNDRIFARIKPTEKFADADLSNAEYIITADLNNNTLLQKTLVPNKTFAVTANQNHIGVTFWLAALFGGFLLNIMPCVFPLLMLWFLFLFRLNRQPAEILRRHLRLFLCGIAGAAVITACLITADKFRNIPFGWGIQLQNMPFLVAMLFIGVSAARLLPQILSEISLHSVTLNAKYLNPALGVYAWLLALSCGAPYVSSVINTAYNGSSLVMITAVAAIALGFCLPILWLLKCRRPQTFFAFLNRHKMSVNILLKFALWVAFFWYLWLIAEQTSFAFAGKMLIGVGVFAYLIGVCGKFLQYLDGVFEEKITPEYLRKLRCGTYIVIVIVSIGFIVITGWRALLNRQEAYKIKTANYVNQIDEAQIQKDLTQGKSVLVSVSADWCFLCRMNNFLIFNGPNLKKWAQRDRLQFINADVSNYNPQIIEYMRRFDTRPDLPFYVLYTPLIRNGLILPQTPDLGDIDRLLLYNR